ncbi:MAG TPA: RagB/SusD family nutrient uptake outer membrane protein, partial [Longimicrobium sp.]|nr:RagB/SusD family nutrient uptake outer membrane protein [Longimicrobium sp.]
MMKLKNLAFGLFAAASMAACDSPLDTQPRSNVPSEEALDSPEEIRVAVNGLYDAFQDNGRDFTRNQVIFPDLYADGSTFSGTYSSDREVVNRNVLPTNTAVAGIWRSAYIGIDRANNVLAALETVEIGAAEKAELGGEARFVRGYMYFILGRWFGGVPLVTEPTREIPTPEEVQIAKSTQAQVYAFAEADLRAAAAALGEEPFNGRGSFGAATALLSRLNLETRDWAEAAAFATDVIESGEYSLVDDFAGIWRNKNSSESIFEVQYTVNDANALAFWLNPQGRQSFSPSTGLINAFNSVGDTERKGGTLTQDQNGTYFSKYSRVESGDDNYVMIRLGEMYLNRSEALARLGTNLGQAVADINTLRARAGVAPLDPSVDTAAEILTANLAERRRELALEGFRFFDLRRFSDRSDVFVGAVAVSTYFN